MGTFNGEDTPETLIYHAVREAADRYDMTPEQIVCALAKIAGFIADDVQTRGAP